MQSWVTQELPAVIRAAFPIDGSREAVSGHSMGGHGALVCALRNPGRYRSVSAFAPICAPTRCPWGRKALTTYLGPEQADWSGYDASLLLRDNGGLDELLVDQGEDDEFLTDQLMPEQLEQAAAAAGCGVTPLPLNSSIRSRTRSEAPRLLSSARSWPLNSGNGASSSSFSRTSSSVCPEEIISSTALVAESSSASVRAASSTGVPTAMAASNGTRWKNLILPPNI